MSATLMGISAGLSALEELLLEAGGDVSDPEADAAVDAWFAELGGARDQKVDDYCSLYEKLKRRGERRKRLAESDAKAAARLKERLQYFFEVQGISKLETDSYRLSIANNGGLLPLLVDRAPEALPAEFQKITVAADNEAIRRALESGEPIDFAHFGERGRHLRIK